MKKFTLLIFALLFMIITANSQSPCLPEGITFTTQEQIDNFQTNYPGCTEIEGNVIISDYYGSGNITNLNGLSVLTYIGGDFYIGYYYADNPSLMTLSGLENLTSVCGHFRIRNNVSLTSLNGLENLNTVGGRLSIYENDNLNNLLGLGGLNSIGYLLTIAENNVLTSLAGLNNLSSIGGILFVINNDSLTSLTGLDNIESGSIDSLYIYDNYSLVACDVESLCEYLMAPAGVVNIYNNASGCNNPGEIAAACGNTMPCLPFGNYYFNCQEDVDNFQFNYPGCTELYGEVTISGNNITNLNGLNAVTTIWDNFEIKYNDSLTSLIGLDNLTFIGGNFSINSNVHLSCLTGLESLSIIGGDFLIEGYSPTSLTGLENLDSIGGSLSIWGTDSLVNLNGFDNLLYIGDSLYIAWNHSLVNFSGLTNLNYVAGNITIQYNDALTNLTGLENLDSIGGNLTIGYSGGGGNPSMTSLMGLEGLISVEGSIVIAGNYTLTGLTGMENLTFIGGDLALNFNALISMIGLENLNSIGGNFKIDNNDILTNLMGLENLTSIGNNLWLGWAGGLGYGGGNINLNDISALSSLTSIGGEIQIYGSALTSLTGLENINPTSINGLTIIYNQYLSTCEVQSICDYLVAPSGNVSIGSNASGCNTPNQVALACGTTWPCPEYLHFQTQEQIDNFQFDYPGCTEIDGWITIDDHETGSITNLLGLSVLTAVDNLYIGGYDYYIYLHGNPALSSLIGLENITTIPGNLIIVNNNALNNFNGLENINSIGGDLDISDNETLTSLTGLENLNSIGGSVYLGNYNYNLGNPALTALSGFENLNSIVGSLIVYNNDDLIDLSGLHNLSSIGDSLLINFNYSLTSLNGLDNVDANSLDNLTIKYNAVLSECDVQSICDYLAIPGASVEIYNNDPGCNNPAEVEAHCLTKVEEITAHTGIIIVPNPSNERITVYTPAYSGNILLSIFTVSGEKVMEKQIQGPETRLDISALPPGVYFVRVQNEKSIEVVKMIKQ